MAVGYHWSLRFFMNDNERAETGCGRTAAPIPTQPQPNPNPSQTQAKPKPNLHPQVSKY